MSQDEVLPVATTQPSTSQNAPAPTTQNPTNTTTIPETSPPSQTFVQRLNAAEHLWAWKASLRAIAIILAIIGVGCTIWIFTTATDPFDSDYPTYGYTFDDKYAIVWTFITFPITVIWCAICILVLLLRRPNAPVHPGAAVGLDLLIWLGYIATGLFAVLALYDVKDFGSGGTLGYYGYGGQYEQRSNGTWVWITDASDSYYYGTTRPCDENSTSSTRYEGYPFATCAEQDAYVNDLWAQKSHRVNVETTAVVCQFLCLFIHLALFIWACVDTNRRNRRAVSKDAEKLANDIVMRMIQTGAVAPVNRQGEMGTPLLHTQQSQPQGWAPQQQFGQQQQQAMGWGGPVAPPPPAVVGPEKGQAERFA